MGQTAFICTQTYRLINTSGGFLDHDDDAYSNLVGGTAARAPVLPGRCREGRRRGGRLLTPGNDTPHGSCGSGCGSHPIDYVDLVDCDHGRTLPDLQCGQESVARICTEGRTVLEAGSHR